jgi:predicted DNA-binding transcriptional regulator YafY
MHAVWSGHPVSFRQHPVARSDRLFRLLHLLRSLPPPVTAARLAEETGVSPRTLYRDIESLRGGGALIDGAAGVGYVLTEDPALPPHTFTRLEIEALVLGLGEARVAGDPALAEAADAALAKITATLPERLQRQAVHAVSKVHRYQTRSFAADALAVLRESAWEERAVDLRYVDQAGNETRRRVWPLATVFLDRELMLLAWCTLRQDFRRFAAPRILSATATADSFRPRRVALLRDFVALLSG